MVTYVKLITAVRLLSIILTVQQINLSAIDNRPMVECDSCKDWFHLGCVDLTPSSKSLFLRSFYLAVTQVMSDCSMPSFVLALTSRASGAHTCRHLSTFS
jgi:hypothetical protein